MSPLIVSILTRLESNLILVYQSNQFVIINLVCELFAVPDSYRKINKKNICLNDYTNFLKHNDDINLMETMKCDYVENEYTP